MSQFPYIPVPRGDGPYYDREEVSFFEPKDFAAWGSRRVFRVEPQQPPAERAPMPRGTQRSLPVGGGAAATLDTAADMSLLVRTAAAPIANYAPHPALSLLTETSASYALVGPYNAKKAHDKWTVASQINDKEGMAHSGAGIAQGTLQGIGGVLSPPNTIVGIANQAQQSSLAAKGVTNVVTPLSTASLALGVVSSIVSVIFFSILGVSTGVRAYRSIEAYRDLQGMESDADRLGFILDDLQPSIETFQPGQCREKGEEAIQQGLQYPGDEACIESLNLTQEQKAGLRAMKRTPAELFGLKLLHEERLARREAKWTRIMGAEALQEVKNAARLGLRERLADPNDLNAQAEARALFEKIDPAMQKQAAHNGVYTTACTVGIVCSIVGIGLFALSPAGLVALTVGGIIMALFFILGDGYGMITGLEKGQPGPYDRYVLIAAAAILVAVLITAVVLTIVFASPLLPLFMALATGIVMLACYGYAYHRAGRLEEQWKVEHPDIATVNAVPNAQLPQFYKRLPKADRHALRARYAAMEGDQEAVVNAYLDRHPNDNSLLLRAAKRVAKEEWAEARRTGDSAAAREFQAIYEHLKDGDHIDGGHRDHIDWESPAGRRLQEHLHLLILREDFSNAARPQVFRRHVQEHANASRAAAEPSARNTTEVEMASMRRSRASDNEDEIVIE